MKIPVNQKRDTIIYEIIGYGENKNSTYFAENGVKGNRDCQLRLCYSRKGNGTRKTNIAFFKYLVGEGDDVCVLNEIKGSYSNLSSLGCVKITKLINIKEASTLPSLWTALIQLKDLWR